jgi:hypothetical protein
MQATDARFELPPGFLAKCNPFADTHETFRRVQRQRVVTVAKRVELGLLKIFERGLLPDANKAAPDSGLRKEQ